MKLILTLILTSMSFLGIAQSYDIVLATDFDGNVTEGSKEVLIKYIREGKPVRVGYQLDFDEDKVADFDHWAPATFITILKNDVFTQIDPIFMQGPNMDLPQIEIFPSPTQWTAVIGTNSKLLNRFILNEDLVAKLKADTSLPEAEKEIQIASLEKNVMDMKKVETWQVATFWSVQK